MWRDWFSPVLVGRWTGMSALENGRTVSLKIKDKYNKINKCIWDCSLHLKKKKKVKDTLPSLDPLCLWIKLRIHYLSWSERDAWLAERGGGRSDPVQMLRGEWCTLEACFHFDFMLGEVYLCLLRTHHSPSQTLRLTCTPRGNQLRWPVSHSITSD